MERTKIIAINAVVVAIICLLLLWGNTYYRQWSQFRKGEEALSRQDYIAAIAGYESAIHMYTPGSPLVGRSAGKLWALGNAFEKAGDTKRALIAYRSLRSSFYAVRGLFTPGKEWIALSESRIDALTGNSGNVSTGSR